MAVVRNIQTNDLYLYQGDNTYRNLRTGKTGVIPEEQARQYFKINLEATQVLHDFPLIEEMIRRLNMVCEK